MMITESAGQTQSLGERLAKFLRAGDVIALTGDLGSGKTTFTKGIARGLGVASPEYVNSPSFVLIKEYEGRLTLYHMDLYRLGALEDIEYIGPREYMDRGGVVVIEWAERFFDKLPEERLDISIKIIGKDKRRFNFKSYGKRYDTVINRYFRD